jgi:hypothetical protein
MSVANPVVAAMPTIDAAPIAPGGTCAIPRGFRPPSSYSWNTGVC